MSQPIITDAAQADLDEACGFLARKSPKAAEGLIDRFVRKARIHVEFPESGARDDLGPGPRSFVVAPYVVFFSSDRRHRRDPPRAPWTSGHREDSARGLAVPTSQGEESGEWGQHR